MITAQEKVSLNQIRQISIVVKDVQRATEFYRDRLGMKHLFNAGTLSFFDCGGIRLMLSTAENPEFDHPASIIYYTVDDIVKAYDALLAQGVHFEGEPHMIAKMPDHELWMVHFRDSENNLLSLMSEVR